MQPDRTLAEPGASATLVRHRRLAGVGLHYIGHRLGHALRSERWLRERVDWLVANQRFPHHLPSPRPNERIYNGAAVDAWFDGQLDHASAERIDAVDRLAFATILDARARAIGAGTGGNIA